MSIDLWILIGTVVIAIGTVALIVLKIWPKRAKPRLKVIENCCIKVKFSPDSVQVFFELIVENPGLKNCSVVSIKLLLDNEIDVDLSNAVSSTPLPIPIGTDLTERIKMTGFSKTGKSVLWLKNKFVEGLISVKFNTGKSITSKATFIVSY